MPIVTSYVYVLHFHSPLSHAKHYVGCTAALAQRMETHANGHGARLMEELMLQGMTWELGGLFSTCHAEMRRHEKSLKRMHNAERYCQLCHPRDQKTLPGTQKENVHNVPFACTSEALCRQHVDLATVEEIDPAKEDATMRFILSLMRKDKDALGFVPVGGVKGIKRLVEARQIVLAHENNEPCGYVFYTKSVNGQTANIHQACVADGVRLKGHGEAMVQRVLMKNPGATCIAKVRDDLAANHFWKAIGFTHHHSKTHKTSGSTIHHYHKESI